MKKIEAGDPSTQSADVVAGNVTQLKALFPEAVTEGKIDFDVLKQLLSGEVEDREEKYGLNWHGKRKARQLALTPSTGTLRPCPEESVDWDTTQNLMIEGDNLEVLKLLQKSYAGKVKLIYIDPPYNTGKDFVYPDDFRDNIKNYLELTGQVEGGRKISSNTDASGRFHTDWLNMMYPRLKLARALLRPEGIICVSIDDNEAPALRLLLDDVFGQENFVASMIWQKMDSPSRNEEDRYVSNYHDYVIIYARDAQLVGLKKKSKPEILQAYPFRLPDGRLARRRQLRKNGKSARRQDRETMWFPLTAPDGTEVWPVAPEGWEGRWVLSKETWQERTAQGLTDWKKRKYGWVPYYIETAPGDPGVPWPTIWTDLDQNRQAKAEYTALMGSEVDFDSPKPTSLVKRLLTMATANDDICLDFFAGSGTTAHAVMALNREDGSNRRFILVQLPEPVSSTSEKISNIADITKLRIRKAISSLAAPSTDDEDKEQVEPEALGFRAFRLDSSNIRAWNPDRGDFAKTLVEASVSLKDDRTEQDILFELLLKLGLDLTVPIETKQVAGKSVHSIGAGVLLACLDKKIGAKEVEALGHGIAEWHKKLAPAGESTIVFRDSAFADDVAKTNVTAILQQHGLENVRSL